MVRVDSFESLIRKNPLSSTPAIQAFSNYTQGFLAKEGSFEPEAIFDFFNCAMQFPFWQENRKELLADLIELLNSDDIQQSGFLINTKDLIKSLPEQVIELRSQREICDVINCYLTFHLRSNGTQFRLAQISPTETVAIALNSNHSIEIFQFNEKFVIRAGHLEPLLKNNRILFNSHDLSLEEEFVHRFHLSPGISVAFQIDDLNEEIMSGGMFRGSMFERMETIHRQKMINYPKIFYYIRKVEGLFLSKDGNPFYQMIVQGLESLREQIRLDKSLPTHTNDLVARAIAAKEHVFHNDTILDLLIREISLEIAARTKNI